MKIDGIYWVQFAAFTGMWGNLILVLENGVLRGGDEAFVLIGKYRIEGDVFVADVVSTRYTDKMPGALGHGDSLCLTFKGPVTDGKSISVTGFIEGNPTETITAKLVRAHGLEPYE